jgi:hypothetical protein
MQISPVGAKLIHVDGQDRYMDGHNDANSHFCEHA